MDGNRTSKVLMEIQLMNFVLGYKFLEFINEYLRHEWLEDTLWVNKYCVTPLCKTYGECAMC